MYSLFQFLAFRLVFYSFNWMGPFSLYFGFCYFVAWVSSILCTTLVLVGCFFSLGFSENEQELIWHFCRLGDQADAVCGWDRLSETVSAKAPFLCGQSRGEIPLTYQGPWLATNEKPSANRPLLRTMRGPVLPLARDCLTSGESPGQHHRRQWTIAPTGLLLVKGARGNQHSIR